MKRILPLILILALLLPCVALCETLNVEAGSVEDGPAELLDLLASEDEQSARAVSNGATALKVKDGAKKTVTLGKTYQLQVSGKTIKACKSDDKKVAKVTDKGLLTPVKAGKTTVTITLKDGKKLGISISVNKAPKELKQYFGMKLKTAAKKIGGLKAYTTRFEIYKYYGYRNKYMFIECFGKPNGKVDTIVLKKPSNYSLFGIQLGMKKAKAQSKLGKYQRYITEDNYESYWIKKTGSGTGTILDISYKNGKVSHVTYQWYGN